MSYAITWPLHAITSYENSYGKALLQAIELQLLAGNTATYGRSSAGRTGWPRAPCCWP